MPEFMKISFFSMPLLLIPLWCTQPASKADQISSFTFYGSYDPMIRLTSGSPVSVGKQETASLSSSGRNNAIVVAPQPDVENFHAMIDFGDLSEGDGSLAVGRIGLRVRSNTSYRVVASVLSFQADQLMWQGKNVTSSDGKDFLQVAISAPSATGLKAAPVAQTRSNSSLLNGERLSDLATGPVSTSSTVLISGDAASGGGTLTSVDNAQEVGVAIAAPTGFELGPAPGSSRGTFSAVIQFGAIPGE